jgi:D-arabinose 1-dehydrogenase-like Zn-dependent alcohol dehydrogenase
MSILSRTSRAAVLVDYNQPLEIRELTVPPLEPGAILVKVEAATVCRSEDANTALTSMARLQEIKPAIVPS